MIMQFLSVFFGALSVWALFYDYIVRDGSTVLLSGEAWYALSPGTLERLQAGIERHVWPPLWSDIVLPILETPFWLFCAGLAILFVLLWAVFQRRRYY